LIHIIMFVRDGGSGRANYFNLDTSSDTLSSKVEAMSDSGADTLGRSVSICKLENGNLVIRVVSSNITNEVWRSTDGGDNWTELSAKPGEDDDQDRSTTFPTDSSDNNDLMCLEWQIAQDTIQANIWDDSASSWTTTDVGTAGDFVWTFQAGPGAAGVSNFWSSTFRQSDKTVILAVHEDKVGTSHDLRIFTLNWDGTTLTITEKTKVLTATSTVAGVAILVNNNNDDIYVTYLDGTDGSVVAQQVKSTDGGATWGSPVQVSDEDTDYVALIDSPQVVKSGGRIHPLFVIPSGSTAAIAKQKNPSGTPIPPPEGVGNVVPKVLAAMGF